MEEEEQSSSSLIVALSKHGYSDLGLTIGLTDLISHK